MDFDPYNPDYEYIAYIDESGETGLTNILSVDPTGSSEWFILSLVLVPKSEENNIDAWISEMIQSTTSNQLRDLHFARLPDSYKGGITRILAAKPVMCFVVCSNKKNMRRHKNRKAEAAMAVKDWFYCWITRLALERASHFVHRRSIQKFGKPKYMKIVFSERGGLRVGQIGAYYQWIRQQSRNDNLYIPWGDIEWSVINQLLITTDFAKHLSGLKLADVVAAAFYGACDNQQSGPCNPEYARNLQPVVARFRNNETGMYSGYGLKLLPSFYGAKLSAAQQEIFRHYGYPAQLWQKGKSWEVLPPPDWLKASD